jgi:hypothetical protein
MDPAILLIIATIIVLILVLDVYKRQNDKITSNLHADNLKQMLTISAIEYKVNTGISAETEPQLPVNEITQLINRYERGEIQADDFQHRMDHLLNTY